MSEFALPRVSEQSELLLALAARCEVEGPSRKLDLDISVAIDFRGVFLPIRAGESYRWGAGGDEIELRSSADKRIGTLDPDQFVPRWTTSLDSAVTLFPSDRTIHACWSMCNHVQPSVQAWKHHDMSGEQDIRDVEAKTLALALCAAALRARAAIVEAEGL